MRKGLVIGAIAAVVIGVAGYFLSQPRRGTVDYKRKYLEAHELGVIGEWINFRGPMALQDLYWRPKYKRIDFHRNALLEANYLVRREFVLSNRSVRALIDDLHKIRFDVFTDTNDFAGIPFFTKAGTNRIEVLARAIDIGKWEDAIRKFDVPEPE